MVREPAKRFVCPAKDFASRDCASREIVYVTTSVVALRVCSAKRECLKRLEREVRPILVVVQALLPEWLDGFTVAESS